MIPLSLVSFTGGFVYRGVALSHTLAHALALDISFMHSPYVFALQHSLQLFAP